MDDELALENAEREASEVLRSLLSLARENKETNDAGHSEVIVVETPYKDDIQWDAQVANSLFTISRNIDYNNSSSSDVIINSEKLPENDSESNAVIAKESGSGLVRDDVIMMDSREKSSKGRKYCKVDVSAPSQIESSAQEVRSRFEMGCECEETCFKGLSPESVYKHRLNIAELTKEEHDMYLMGLTMACMSNPSITMKKKSRLRLRPHYVYHGRKVCLSAFLYLENCTLYQLKMIRKHVTTHGVVPRIHGNHGKKPHNMFPLETYHRATVFLKSFILQHSSSQNTKAPVILPSDMTRKAMHDYYKEYVLSVASPSEKIMGYSTFRHFMKEQFPNLRFAKTELGPFHNNMTSKVR